MEEFNHWKLGVENPMLSCFIGDTKDLEPIVIAGDDKSACGQLFIVVAKSWNKLLPQDEPMNQRSLGPICNTGFNPWFLPELHNNFHKNLMYQEQAPMTVKQFSLFPAVDQKAADSSPGQLPAAGM